MSEVPLSAITEVNPTIRVPKALSSKDSVSFIPMGDVSESGHWTYKQTRPLKSVTAGFTAFEEGDVLVAKITPCLENGKGVHAVGLENGIGFGSTEFHVLRARPGNAPRFVFHLTQWRRFRRAAEGQMVGSAGQQRVPRAFFDEFPVASFDADQQAIIAQILDILDSAIHETEAIIAKLKAVKQGLLHDLLTRGIDANGELRPPQAEVPHLYKPSPLGWIPKEWDVASLACLLSEPPRNGLYKPPHLIGRGTLLVGQTAFTEDGSVDFDMARRAQVGHIDLSAFGLRAGDLLVSRVFATLDGVGQPVIVPELSEDAVYESNMMRLRTKVGVVTSTVLFNLLKLPASRAAVRSRAFLSNQASINRQGICSIELPLPPWKEQLATDARIKTLADQLKHETEALSKYRAQKAGLMDDLLTGRVRVAPLLKGTAA
jgi:type I restriction enzyme S subunit